MFGAAGRMGATVCQAVLADPDLELVAAVDPHHAGLDLRHAVRWTRTFIWHRSAEALVEAGAEVAVDFTERRRRPREPCLSRPTTASTRWSARPASRRPTSTTCGPASRESNCLVAPNFAIGAVLMMRFAELAAPCFETAEVIELHHDRRSTPRPAPPSRPPSAWRPRPTTGPTTPTEKVVVEGARGGAGPGGIPVHSVRLRGLVAHQEVLLGTTGQTLTIRHDTYDRSSFMPGVLLAIKPVAARPGLTVGLDELLTV